MEVVYECGINCNGSMDIAEKMIDVAHSSGCKYVKFQKRTIDLVYSKEELARPRDSQWGTTTREQKEGLEFNWTDYRKIDDYCRGKCISWFASPWDTESIQFLVDFNKDLMKIPSALITNHEFLEECRDTGAYLILSTGMCHINDIDAAIDIIGKERIYCLMHCTSTYPSMPEEINAKCIITLKELYPKLMIGFSNHYPGLMAMILAAAYGAEMIEFHGTLDRAMVGSDQAASIEPQGVFELMQRLQLVEKMKGDGVKRIYEREYPIIDKLRGIK